jgi:uncharacterized phage protein (TIGR02218 family)
MPKSISTALAAHYAGSVTTLAILIKITRTDGVILAVTNHDTDITYLSQLYSSKANMDPSSIATNSTMSVDNLDMHGALLSVGITEADIESGLWDNAEIRIYRVNWADLSMGDEKLIRGWIGQISIGRNDFKNELRSLAQKLQNSIGEIVSVNCKADLFDSRCKILEIEGTWKFSNVVVDSVIVAQLQFGASALTQSGGTVVTVTGQNVSFSNNAPTALGHNVVAVTNIVPAMVEGIDYTLDPNTGTIFILPGSTIIPPGPSVPGSVDYFYATSGFFDEGKILWTTGLNTGLSKEVKVFSSGGYILLQEQMPYEIALGDQFTVWAGCSKRYDEDCKTKFSNGINFRGFPKLPGIDAVLRGPQ